MGAPHIWVTPEFAMASYMPLVVTPRRQTWVPAWAVMVQGKHQPLQWNMGSVHRYTGWCGSAQVMMLPMRVQISAPMMVDDALGLPVVPEV